MTLTKDNKPAASNILFPKRGQEVKVVMWSHNMALCEAYLKGKPKRVWIVKNKLK